MTTKKPTYKFVKLDKRHKAWGLFSHRLEFFNVREYLEMREQFWKDYGPGCERDLAFTRDTSNFPKTQWAWHTSETDYSRFLYLADGPVLTHFQLSRT